MDARAILSQFRQIFSRKSNPSPTTPRDPGLEERAAREYRMRAEYIERAAELIEARQMHGPGPWLVHEDRGKINSSGRFQESNPLISQGAYGDIELALQNVDWRREVNLSWLEFSRWGIQQIILIARLYYVKNPIARRLIDIAAFYVFALGVEVSSPDEAANDVLKDFFDRNAKIIGHSALVDMERRKYYDGNLFFVLFPDTQNTGKVNIRTIDATEVQDIVCDPDDSDAPWYYRRNWTARTFDQVSGVTATENRQAWYPALGYEPANRPQSINGLPVMWDSPVYHRRAGAVAKWHFGCPIIYPLINWAKASKEFLEACLTVRQTLAQWAYKVTTKGGQQAMAGIKQQMQTTVGTGASLWDTNPPTVPGGGFVSGPGTTLEPFNTRGAGADPEEVRQYKLMCCMVVGVPETFLSDVSTGNLATATTLDRPTELCFLEKQQSWVEDLTIIAQYVLRVSLLAPSGRLREARMVGAKPPEVSVNFPAIREGDIPALVDATVKAMTLGSNTVEGIDAKAGVRHLYDLLGMENGDQLTEESYPEGSYEPDRTLEPETVGPPAVPSASALENPDVEPMESARSLARKLVQAVKHENGVHSAR